MARLAWGVESLLAGAMVCAASGCTAEVQASRQPQRPDTPDTTELPPAFSEDEVVERYDSPRFRVHYTRSGPNAVPADDTDADGTPDYVATVAAQYEAVLTFFVDELGFDAPLDDRDVVDNGGDARFDVYLLAFPTGADGSFRRDECTLAPTRCPGHMLQDNNFSGRGYPSLEVATRILASHELFHAVQAGYAIEPGAVVSEGTAVWASEAFDGELDDFEHFIGAYLRRTERSLGQEPAGPVDPYSYGAALFFRFLEERFDRTIVRALWETEPTDPSGELRWLDALDGLLQARGSSFADAFFEFARWNLLTGLRANPERAYARGAAYPEVTERAAALPFQDELVRLFPASARYYTTGPTRGPLQVALQAREGALDEVRLLVAFDEGDGLRFEAADGPTLEARSDDALAAHVVLVSTARYGASQRFSLCIGAPGEVARCRAAHTDAGPVGDAGPMDGGAMDGALADGGDTGPMESGGCTVVWRSASNEPTPLTALVALALLFRRRRSAPQCPPSGPQSGPN